LDEFEQKLLGNPDLHIETTPEIQAALQDAFPQISSAVEKILKQANLDVGHPAQKVGFLLEQKFIDSFGEDSNGKRYLPPELEKNILDNLSKGKELILSYYHVKPYEKRIDGRPGFLTLPDSGPYISRKEINAYNAQVTDPRLVIAGPHNATLVDVILGRTGRIEYLVIRNSWGLRETSDQGYYYISVDYLAEYGNAYIADISVIRKP
jgi:hypothetical protein